jgi:hypothetical protein
MTMQLQCEMAALEVPPESRCEYGEAYMEESSSIFCSISPVP